MPRAFIYSLQIILTREEKEKKEPERSKKEVKKNKKERVREKEARKGGRLLFYFGSFFLYREERIIYVEFGQWGTGAKDGSVTKNAVTTSRAFCDRRGVLDGPLCARALRVKVCQIV